MASINTANLFNPLPSATLTEVSEVLAQSGGVRVERIVSLGQITPPGDWYDQQQNEFVVLLSGAARLLIEGEATARELRVGDWLVLEAHVRHRVEWTDPQQATVWLAVFYPHPVV
jgi:cupin 2 domain-containing protein